MDFRVSFAVQYPHYKTEIVKGATQKKFESILRQLNEQMAEGLIEDFRVEVLQEQAAPDMADVEALCQR